MGQADLEFQVHWTLGDVTWEPLARLASCKELAALDEYLELYGAKQPHNLLYKAQ